MFLGFLILVYSVTQLGTATNVSEKPHIVLIIADDLGWNDVGFHGSNEIPTPNIDALAYNGLILNRHYTQSTCTPSRAALLTGKYPIRMGMQGFPILEGVPVAVPSSETMMPQQIDKLQISVHDKSIDNNLGNVTNRYKDSFSILYHCHSNRKYLKELGYQTRLIGKWHVGSYKREFTPTERGFDSFFGYYNGWVRYNDSVCGSELLTNMIGIDARNNFEKAGHRFYRKYNTDVFTDEAVDIINRHNQSVPLFLDISYTAVHAIVKNTIQVRNLTETEQRFAYIKDSNRRLLAGALTALDESIGRIIRALHSSKMLRNSIVMFMSDNGGPTFSDVLGKGGVFQNFASNWPLRGVKGALTEGAVRCAAAIWSPLLRRRDVIQEKIHLVDWLPTLFAAAGGNVSRLGNIDGVDQWKFLTESKIQSPRKRLLININEVIQEKAFIMGKWKYIKSPRNARLRYGEYSGRDDDLFYNLTLVIQSPVHKILRRYDEKRFSKNVFLRLRRKANVALQGFCKNRTQINSTEVLDCFQAGCLFNIKKDPCEMYDLSTVHPNVMQHLKSELNVYEKQLIPQQNCTKDERANPKYFENYWTSWIETEPTTCVK